MQSLKSERAKKEYEQFVKEVTPKQNLFCNMAKAFIVGGLICVVGRYPKGCSHRLRSPR